MPRVDFEALEAWRQARRDRRDNSNDSTVVNDDDDNDGGIPVNIGQDNLANLDLNDEMNMAAIEDSRSTTSMIQRVLMFNQGAAESLYNDQMITTIEILQELDDDTIKETYKAIRKPAGGTLGYQISEISMTRFKLFAFWARHMWRTCRTIDD